MDDKTKSEADALLESRRAVYGDRPDQMRRTAKIWSGLTGFPFEPWMIPMLMSSYKMLRAFNAPDYSDNVDDVDGWMVMFREQMEADGQPIINARTVEEYLHKKFSGNQNEGQVISDYMSAREMTPAEETAERDAAYDASARWGNDELVLEPRLCPFTNAAHAPHEWYEEFDADTAPRFYCAGQR